MYYYYDPGSWVMLQADLRMSLCPTFAILIEKVYTCHCNKYLAIYYNSSLSGCFVRTFNYHV